MDRDDNRRDQLALALDTEPERTTEQPYEPDTETEVRRHPDADADGDESSGSGRRTRPAARARTISIKRLSKRELERGRELYPETDYPKPEVRADCVQGEFTERPCPYVSCKYHLYLDVSERTGAIKMNFPDKQPWELEHSCSLDVSDAMGMTLEDVGAIMNLTRERIRQVETKGIAKLKALNELAKLQDYCDE